MEVFTDQLVKAGLLDNNPKSGIDAVIPDVFRHRQRRAFLKELAVPGVGDKQPCLRVMFSN